MELERFLRAAEKDPVLRTKIKVLAARYGFALTDEDFVLPPDPAEKKEDDHE